MIKIIIISIFAVALVIFAMRFLSNITFSNSTPIAKPIRTSNPVKRIMAVGAAFDIKKVGKCSIKA